MSAVERGGPLHFGRFNILVVSSLVIVGLVAVEDLVHLLVMLCLLIADLWTIALLQRGMFNRMMSALTLGVHSGR